MSKEHGDGAVGCRLVASSVVKYHAAVVDLRHSRTVHCVEASPCRQKTSVHCCAVHYGWCIPLDPGTTSNTGTTGATSAPQLYADLQDLVDFFVARDRARLAASTKYVNSSQPTQMPMLALASPGIAPPSSSILSAVEKFERKGTSTTKAAATSSAKLRLDEDVKALAGGEGSGSETSAAGEDKSKEMSCTWPYVRKREVPSRAGNGQRGGPLRSNAPKMETKLKGNIKSADGTTSATVVIEKQIEAVGDESIPAETTVAKVAKVSSAPSVGLDNNAKIAKVKTTTKQPLMKVKSSQNKTSGQLTDNKSPCDKHLQIVENSFINSDHLQKTVGTGKKKPTMQQPQPQPQPQPATNAVGGNGKRLATIVNCQSQSQSQKEVDNNRRNGADLELELEKMLNPELSAATNPNPNPNPNQSPKYIEQCTSSPVDYAMRRFQQAFVPTSKVSEAKNGTSRVISENGQLSTSDWAAEAQLVQAAVDALKMRQQRSGTVRKSPSPEPNSGVLLPHPRLTMSQKQHLRDRALSPTGAGVGGGGGSHVPIRPFLTKGSVAERVLIFERCPTITIDKDKSLLAATPTNLTPMKTKQGPTMRGNAIDVQNKTLFWSLVEQCGATPASSKDGAESPRSTLKRLVAKSGGSGGGGALVQPTNIPHFFFPNGRPVLQQNVEIGVQQVAAVFVALDGGQASRDQMGGVVKACGLPLYWKSALFDAAGGDKKGFVTSEAFLDFWKRVISTCHDDASRFIRLLGRGIRRYLVSEDFVPLIQDVVDTHPGLTFLKEAAEFHSRYVQTVIARIFYCVNRSWSGRITATELRKSNFLQVLALLEDEDDINQVTEYFSYEHFYVIYCKFWELDKDHDLLIDKNDLARHNDHAISTRMIERIFSGAVTRGKIRKEQKMTYSEFVWFLISEEDKRHPTSIEYWFRCMDVDGDGFLSMYELEYFYQEQIQRMEGLGIETLPFKDCLCQMLDMLRPKVAGKISLNDLKGCRMTPIFFDTFFNLEKYLDHEQRDPFASQRNHDGDGQEMSDWDRYAAEEYEYLVAEEGINDQQDDNMNYEDGYDQEEDDELNANLEHLALSDPRSSVRGKNVHGDSNFDDEYPDYADYGDSDDYQY